VRRRWLHTPRVGLQGLAAGMTDEQRAYAAMARLVGSRCRECRHFERLDADGDTVIDLNGLGVCNASGRRFTDPAARACPYTKYGCGFEPKGD
jgi:hypothetical protein